MENIIHNIISTYYFAFFAIIFGAWKLNDTINNTPRNTDSALQPFIRGIAGSIGAITLGIIILYQKIKG
jgi:hypothetical protein